MKGRTLFFLGVGALGVAGTGFVFYKKNQLEKIAEQLTFSLSRVENLKFSIQKLSVSLGIQIFNPTSEDLNLNTGFIKLKELRVFEKKTNNQLAFSSINSSSIKILSQNSFEFPLIHLELNSLTALQFLINFSEDDLIEKFSFELDISGLGFKKTIKF